MDFQEAENSPTHDPLAHGFYKEAPTRPLHDCACYLISLTHTLLERITHMPFPIGTIIKCTEAMVNRWTHPLVQSLECHGLYLLGAIDNQIFAMISFAEGCAACTAKGLKLALSLVCTPALIKTAGLWYKYEGMVKQDIQKALCLANKLPLVNLVTPVVCAISSPLAMPILDWLLKQGERIERATQTMESTSVMQKQVEIEGMNLESNTLSCMVAGPTIKLDVTDRILERKDVSMDATAKDMQFEGGNVRIDDVHLARKDVNVDDVLVGGTEASTSDDIVEDDVHPAGKDVSVDVNVDEDAVVAGKSNIEGPLDHIEEGDDSLPDVLEMIESNWLLGKPTSVKKLPSPPRTRHISNPVISSGFFRINWTFFSG